MQAETRGGSNESPLSQQLAHGRGVVWTDARTHTNKKTKLEQSRTEQPGLENGQGKKNFFPEGGTFRLRPSIFQLCLAEAEHKATEGEGIKFSTEK